METNYCAHAVDSLNQTGSRTWAEAIDSAVKFRLPKNGDLLGWNTSKKSEEITDVVQMYCNPFRLPYQDCVVEYMSDTWGACVVIAKEKEVNGNTAIEVISFNIKSGRWFLNPVFCIVEHNGKITFTPNTEAKQNYSFLTQDLRIQLEQFIFISAVSPVLQFIAALSCNNVSKTISSPNQKINKKRSKSGKQPFYTYHELLVQSQSESSDCGGTHASPRVHIRRGHIRRLPKGNIWVNACVVGNKELGIVEKHYRLEAAHEAA